MQELPPPAPELTSPGPLSGLLVVSIEQALAAPLCTCRLADAGARVIKIERDSGDFARGYDSVVNGEASYFVWTNRGKESVQLDLHDADDQALVHRMLENADVFVQNLGPGAAQRAGFGSAELRERYPRLITCDISGYGEDGPYRDMKAYDLLVQSESGLVSVSGPAGEYGRIGVSICDIGAGMNALIGIQLALLARASSGRGSSVQVSLFDTAADWMTVPVLHQAYAGKGPQRVGLNHPSIAPYGGFQTADGETLVVAVQNEREWRRFANEFLGDPALGQDPRFASNNLRVANRPQLDALIRQAFAGQTRTALERQLREAGIAYGAVNSTAALLAHPQLRTWPVATPSGEAILVAPPVRSEHDGGRFRAVPALGQHSAAVRAEFALQQSGTHA
jgi:crotonobetainyl-CoA:carnitine CoA-transferase CaiB-like acyl-CoA transferase